MIRSIRRVCVYHQRKATLVVRTFVFRHHQAEEESTSQAQRAPVCPQHYCHRRQRIRRTLPAQQLRPGGRRHQRHQQQQTGLPGGERTLESSIREISCSCYSPDCFLSVRTTVRMPWFWKTSHQARTSCASRPRTGTWAPTDRSSTASCTEMASHLALTLILTLVTNDNQE